jgi:hypothetical protein
MQAEATRAVAEILCTRARILTADKLSRGARSGGSEKFRNSAA